MLSSVYHRPVSFNYHRLYIRELSSVYALAHSGYVIRYCAMTESRMRQIGQARSSFHLSVFESIYIKSQNPVLYKQKEFTVSLAIFQQTMVNRS